MRSAGHLWEAITGEAELREAWLRVRRGHAHSPEVAAFGEALEANLGELRSELIEGRYCPRGYRQFMVYDPKPRTISCAAVRDRVVHHALCAAIAPVLERSFIHNTFACRKGKGTHKACELARRYCGEWAYWCKMDVRKYFESIRHDLLLETLLPKFREAEVKRLVKTIVEFPCGGEENGKGVPIGNLTSQWFANAYLDEFDHLAQAGFGKSGCRYLRYMDDFVFFAESKAKAWELHDEAVAWLAEKRGLDVKSEATRIAPSSEGLPFLGLRIWPNAWRLRRERFVRSRRKFRERLGEFMRGEIDEERMAQCASASSGSVGKFGFKGVITDDLAPGRGASSGSNRVNRGGSWNNNDNNCRSSNRNNNSPSNNNNNLGFRLSSTLQDKSPARDARALRSGDEHASRQSASRAIESHVVLLASGVRLRLGVRASGCVPSGADGKGVEK